MMLTFDDLWEPQKALHTRIMNAWEVQNAVVIQAGMRGGKTMIASVIAGESERPVYLIARSSEGYEHVKLKRRSPQDLPRLVDEARKGRSFAQPGSLVIIEECFWYNYAEELVKILASDGVKVLAIGSRSDEEWKDTLSIWEYATWDLNPNIQRNHPIIEQHFADDPRRAERDYGILAHGVST